MGKSQELYKKAKSLIPGGTQLLSKRPEMFLPDQWPAYYSKSKGCEVWDLDGNKYIDMCFMGIGACILGYADPQVNLAAEDALRRGSMNTLNAPEEVELAEMLIDLHPWAQMVRYAKTGGEAMSIAVRIARAKSKKDVVLFCGYHGWHDWYLSANLADDSALDGQHLPGLNPLGVPRGLKGLSLPFYYNDTEGFLKLVAGNENKIGAIIMESVRNDKPDIEFVHAVNDISQRLDVPLVVDEITAGWRLNQGGAHLIYGIKPDVAVFGKGMSNGFPMAAVVGKKEVMQMAQETFISSTYWTDRIGPAASIAAIKKMKDKNVPKHLISTGKKVKEIWTRLAAKHGIAIEVGGIDPLAHFNFKHGPAQALKTLFTQNMLAKGFLATTAFYASYAHKAEHLKKYEKAADESFVSIADAIESGKPESYLNGPVSHSGFKRLI
jgi:glutamate-1-semialdehyde 2,1-aminomutase